MADDSRFTKRQLELLSRVPEPWDDLPESWEKNLDFRGLAGDRSNEQLKRDLNYLNEMYEQTRDDHFKRTPERNIARTLAGADDMLGNTDEALSVARSLATKNPWALGADVLMKGTKKLAIAGDKERMQALAQRMSNIRGAKRRIENEQQYRQDESLKRELKKPQTTQRQSDDQWWDDLRQDAAAKALSTDK
mgnify:CR=1 FL=1